MGDLFYLIRKGDVDVTQQQGERETTVATLTEGDFFGEVALMTNERRNATVTSRTETLCYTLSQARVQQSAEPEPNLRGRAAQGRLRTTVAGRGSPWLGLHP